MVWKRSATSSLHPCPQDSSDEEAYHDLNSNVDQFRRRKRRRLQPAELPRITKGRTLRHLLGLTPADDFIETAIAPPNATTPRSDNRGYPPNQSSIDKLIVDPGHKNPASAAAIPFSSSSSSSSFSSSSSEDEVVLPLTHASREPTVSAVVATKHLITKQRHVAASSKRSQPFDGSDSGDEPEHPLSLSTKEAGPVPAVPASRETSLVANQHSSEDDDEVTLVVKPPISAPRSCSDVMGISTTLSLAADVAHGHRPAFLVPSELLNIGPLELAPGVLVPETINRFLRSYQRDGVRFLYRSYSEGRGALLGDDMGLGKTIQVIAFLSAIMSKTGREEDADRRIEAERSDRRTAGIHTPNAIWPTCLIICPSSVIDNWRHELDTWGYFEHAAYGGSRARTTLDGFRRGRFDILITSHETASMCIEQLRDLDFSCVLIDEAHKLKNPHSQMTQAMQTFRCRARFALTGTAIQNTYRELYTLADWTNPGLLGTVKEWITEIEDPLKHGQKRGADPERIADARTRAEKLVKNVLPIFFLRRTKALIADQLPRKFDRIVFCPLTSTQLDVYKRILSEDEVDLMKRHADPCDCGRIDPDTGLAYRRQNCCFKRDGKGEAWNKNMLKYIYLLQKCSNHVALVFPDPEDANSHEPDRAERYERQLSYVQLMFPDNWQGKRCNAANGMEPEFCGKWKVLAGLLQQWHADGDKVLLFSTNLRLLQFIEFFLAREGHTFLRLDGSTPQPRRQQLVDDFNRNSSIFVFLISTTAGGTGLNLTAANRVVVFDPHWNPSHDLQAMDRAYRFGQSRDVYIYRLIGAGSLEEVIYGRQLYKQQQMEIGYNATKERRYFEGVAGDQGSLGELFGCRNLFTLHESNLAMKSIIDECNISEVTFALEQYLKAGSLNNPDTVDAAFAERPIHQRGNQPETLRNEVEAGSSKQRADGVADSFRSILDMSGIAYSHDHATLVGNSTAEAALYSTVAQQGSFRRRRRGAPGVKTRAKKTVELPDAQELPSRCPSDSLKTALLSIWPPPRSKGPTASDNTATQEESYSLAVAEMGLQQAISRDATSRMPDLSDLAELKNTTEVELAAFINAMPPAEQKAWFDTAVQRWNHKEAVRAKGAGQQHFF